MQPVSRQLEAALADIEGSSKSGVFDAIRRYLQLVRPKSPPPYCCIRPTGSLFCPDHSLFLAAGARAQGQGVRKCSPPGL